MKLKSLEQRPTIPHDTAVRLRPPYAQRADLEQLQLAPLLDCAHNALLIVDGYGRIRHANRVALRVLREDSGFIEDTYLQEHLSPLDSERQLLERQLNGRRSIDVALLDGRHARATFTALPARDSQSTLSCVALELSQERTAELALESVGRLAAELAHDLNNQLSAALNYVFILRRRLASDRSLAPHVEELQSSAWRAAALASGLKLLGRKRGNEPELLRIDELLESMEPLLLQAASGVKLELRLPRNVAEVRVPRAHAEQLLLIVTLSAAGRARPNSTIAITVETPPLCLPSDAGCTRVTWQFRPERTTGERRPLSSVRTQSTLRRAVKRCGARLGHDASRIWVEFRK